MPLAPVRNTCLLLQKWNHRLRENRISVLKPFSVAYCYLFHAEVNVLHPQTQHLHQAQAASVDKLRDQLRSAAHHLNHCLHLVRSQDDRDAHRAGCADGLNGSQFLMQHLPV
jgi:hypothetical protein